MTSVELARALELLGGTQIKETTTELTASCPLCPDRHPSFAVSKTKEGNPYNCFSCHSSGLLPRLVMEVKGTSWSQSVQWLNKIGHFDVDLSSAPQQQLPPYEGRFAAELTPEQLISKLGAFDPLCVQAIEFLMHKGIRRKYAEEASFKQFEGRIMIPWFYRGKLTGITSRSYLHRVDRLRGVPFEGFQKHETVYFPQGRTSQEYDTIYLTEGEMDAVRLHQLGFPSGAVSGSSISDTQVKRLLQVVRKRIVLVPDNDDAGYSFIESASAKLKEHRKLLVPILRDQYSDPCATHFATLKSMLNIKNLTLVF